MVELGRHWRLKISCLYGVPVRVRLPVPFMELLLVRYQYGIWLVITLTGSNPIQLHFKLIFSKKLLTFMLKLFKISITDMINFIVKGSTLMVFAITQLM